MPQDSILERSPKFFEALCRQFEAEFHDVLRLLRDLGILVVEDQPEEDAEGTSIQLPSEFILGLYLGVRFRRWELDRISIHTAAGLPTGEELLRTVVSEVSGPELASYIKEISDKAKCLFHQHFAWSGHDDIEADLAVVADLDEDSINAIADFLRKHRHLTNDRKPS